MESTFGNGILLMAVGMISVFVVLTIVVFGGALLVKITNRLLPNIENKQFKKEIDDTVMAVIASTVTHITNGKGKIDTVQKLN